MQSNHVRAFLPLLLVLSCGAFLKPAAQERENAQHQPSTPQVLLPGEARVLRTGARVKPPRMIRQPLPVYPPEAKTKGVEGDVELMAQVDRQGKVSKLCLLKGNPKLAGASVEAVWQWEWEPLMLDDRPYEFETSIFVKFRLSKTD